MAGMPRLVVPHYPHHITQRGARITGHPLGYLSLRAGEVSYGNEMLM